MQPEKLTIILLIAEKQIIKGTPHKDCASDALFAVLPKERSAYYDAFHGWSCTA